MAGLGGFGVELDEYDNNACLDSNDNHIGIDSLGACNTGMVDTLDVQNAPGLTLADGAWHTMIVEVASGAFTVTAGGTQAISAYTPAGWSDAKYHMGFAAGTGGATNFHRVRNVKVSFPAPECY